MRIIVQKTQNTLGLMKQTYIKNIADGPPHKQHAAIINKLWVSFWSHNCDHELSTVPKKIYQFCNIIGRYDLMIFSCNKK